MQDPSQTRYDDAGPIPLHTLSILDYNNHTIKGKHGACTLVTPKVSSLPTAKKADKTRLARLVKQHTKLYVAAQLYSVEKATKKAKFDVLSILHCFPAVTNEDVVLAMCAWLAFFCYIDDAIEKLKNGLLARLALTKSIRMLETGNTRFSLVPVTTAAGEEESDGALLMKRRVNRILSVCGSYQIHLKQYLPDDIVRRDVLQSCSIVLQALLSKWRQQRSIDEAEYLAIRTNGLQPFFVLLQYNFASSFLQGSFSSAYSSTTSFPGSYRNEATPLETMMSSIRLAVAMQHDLVGLERDLAEGDTFNYILRGNPQPDERNARFLRAADVHNGAIQTAVDCWYKLVASDDRSQIQCGECLVTFVERHFRWVEASERYSTGGWSLRRWRSGFDAILALKPTEDTHSASPQNQGNGRRRVWWKIGRSHGSGEKGETGA